MPLWPILVSLSLHGLLLVIPMGLGIGGGASGLGNSPTVPPRQTLTVHLERPTLLRGSSGVAGASAYGPERPAVKGSPPPAVTRQDDPFSGLAPATERYIPAHELNRRPVLLTPLTLGEGSENLESELNGEATYHVFIDRQGKVVGTRLESSSLPDRLNGQAERALRSARFLPGYQKGDPVPSMLRWQITVLAAGIARQSIVLDAPASE